MNAGGSVATTLIARMPGRRVPVLEAGRAPPGTGAHRCPPVDGRGERTARRRKGLHRRSEDGARHRSRRQRRRSQRCRTGQAFVCLRRFRPGAHAGSGARTSSPIVPPAGRPTRSPGLHPDFDANPARLGVGVSRETSGPGVDRKDQAQEPGCLDAGLRQRTGAGIADRRRLHHCAQTGNASSPARTPTRRQARGGGGFVGRDLCG